MEKCIECGVHPKGFGEGTWCRACMRAHVTRKWKCPVCEDEFNRDFAHRVGEFVKWCKNHERACRAASTRRRNRKAVRRAS